MSIRLTGAGVGGTSRARVLVTAGCGLLGLVIGGVFLWVVFGTEPAVAEKASPGAQKLAERVSARRTERSSEAERLRQRDLGEEQELDADGNLLGTRTDGADLPQNRLLAQATPPVPRAEIGAAIEPPRRVASAGEGVSGGTGEDRALVTQPMLGYSTVRAAGWAARRPDEGPERRGPDEAGPSREDRLLDVLERSASVGGPTPAQPGLAGGAGGPGLPMPVGGAAGAGEALYPAQQQAQAFRAGGVGDMRVGGAVGADQIVRQGKFLDCVLVNELRVDLVESPVIVMVSRDFVSLDGRFVLVPAGAKLLGTAGQVGNLQQARVYIRFERIIFPDQRSAYFPVRQVTAADGAGAVGVPGDVDRHFMLQFGAAVMLGVLDGLAGAVQAPGTGTNPGVRDLVAARTSANFSAVVAGILARYANVVPTVTVEPGAKLKVFFAEDVRLSPYMETNDLSFVRRGTR